MDGARSRRDFLRLAAGTVAAGAMGACASGSKKPDAAAKPKGADGKTLRIAQWSHYVPAYDAWFDEEYTQRWGREHDVQVIVDHLTVTELRDRATAEVAAQRGHDLFAFLSPASAFEDEVIDHREIIEEIKARVGPMVPFLERGVLNPKSGRYFGVPNHWSPFLVLYRSDIWRAAGYPSGPENWSDVLKEASALKSAGHPIGFAISPDVDADWSVESLMLAFGASLQDEDGNVTVKRPATVEAVKAATAMFKAGMPQDVFTWDAASNNRFMATGQGSLTLNPITATRAVEKQNPELARHIALAPALAGPLSRLAVSSQNSTYVIWRFAQNREAAEQFLVDLALQQRESFLRSEYVNLPAFPNGVRDISSLLAGDVKAEPPGKYALLGDADAWSTNTGHPGTTNAAVDEVFNLYLLPRMFAAAASGEMTAEEAVRAAEAQIIPIFEKWRERGKI